jgi:hypothetical protein
MTIIRVKFKKKIMKLTHLYIAKKREVLRKSKVKNTLLFINNSIGLNILHIYQFYLLFHLYLIKNDIFLLFNLQRELNLKKDYETCSFIYRKEKICLTKNRKKK